MSSDLSALREKLVGITTRYVATLKTRPDVAGLMLYGSLARGELTPFSDIDMVVVYDGPLPSYGVEHRITEGAKVDLIHTQLDALKELLDFPPYQLYGDHPVSGYVLETLLLGSAETILFDPTGEIARVKDALGGAETYDRIARPGLSGYFHHVMDSGTETGNARREIAQALEAGRFEDAQRRAGRAGSEISYFMRELARIKDVRRAAESLDIPRYADAAEALGRIVSPDPSWAEAIWTAIVSLWTFTLERIYSPVRERLSSEGVPEPEKLELIADRLFWPGVRLNELGRVIAEVDLSLRWSRYELDRGDPGKALDLLWACNRSDDTIGRWKRLGTALEVIEHDCSDLIDPVLSDPELLRLGAELDRANENLSHGSDSEGDARRAAALVEEMATLLAGAFSPMSPEEVSRYDIAHAAKSGEMADALAGLDALCAREGGPERFDQLCEERRSAIAESDDSDVRVADLKSLQRWRLTLEPVPEPNGPPELLAAGAGWIWIDEKGASIHAFLTDDDLEITLPEEARLFGRQVSAPHLTLDVSGDFIVETDVTGHGGIMVECEGEPLVCLGRHIWNGQEVRFEASRHGGDRPSVIGRGRITGERVRLRLQRRDGRLTAWCAEDDAEWSGLGEIAGPEGDPIQFSLYGLRGYGGGDPAVVRFSPVKRWGTTEETR